jgi:hypothetical protein
MKRTASSERTDPPPSARPPHQAPKRRLSLVGKLMKRLWLKRRKLQAEDPNVYPLW